MKKNFLIGFIIAIISIIPIYNVKALTGYDNNIYPDLPDDGHTTSHYVILKSTEDDIALIYYPNSLITTYNNNDNYVSVGVGDRFNFGGWYTSGYSRKVYLYLLDKDNNVWKYRGYDDYGVGNATLLSSINSDIANNLDVFDSYIYQDIVYSNVNFYATYGNNNASIYNHEKSYMYYQTKTLDNSYAFIFTTNNYNSNYKYQIKFNNNSWLDISKALSNNGHSHTINDNGTLYMQILNENNDVIFSRSILITSFKSNKPMIKANFDNNNYYDDNLNITPSYSTNNTEFSKNTYYTGDTSLYLKGSSISNLQYNVNLDSTFDLTFYYYKNDSSSYSRLIYLGGLNREVEIKGSSKNMYITKEITTNWKNKEWNKFRVTRDENNLISYYSNDELIFTETSSTVISYVRFGYGSSSSSNLFNGFIDDISLYNKIYDGKEEESNPIEYTAEKLKTDDGNLDYYKFHIFTSNYNSEYRYMYKFNDTLAFKDISVYLNDKDGYDIQLYSNDTLYLAVYDLSNNLIYSTTYTVTDLYDNVSKPTADIEVGYITNDNNLSQANIHFKFYNYDTSYKYQYSYNDKDYTQISYSDIKNKQYDLVRYSNGTVYLKILDKNDNVIFKKSALIDSILQDENNYYRYVFTIDDLYNKEQNKLLYYVFYYENIKNRGITPLITFTTEGTKVPDLHINMNNNVLDMNSYLSRIKENEITSNINSCTSLPYEYLDTNLNLQSYTSYTAFNFMACIDLENFVYGTDYTDFKLIITSNIDLHLGESIYFNGVLRPSTNDPSKNGFTSEFKIFSDMFNKATKRFWTVLVEIIQNVTLFFNGLSPILQDFYIVIFVLVLFIFIMKFIL